MENWTGRLMRLRCIQCVRQKLAKHPEAQGWDLKTLMAVITADRAQVVYDGNSLCWEHLEERLV